MDIVQENLSNKWHLARQKWQGFHWIFFLDVQGLTLCLLRFETAYYDKNFDSAITELKCAANLLRASGAAMTLAGSFKKEHYETLVRPSMMPPQMSIDDFSGLMSWDHARLIKLWKQLSPIFGELSEPVSSSHKAFIQAFISMIQAHSDVCKKFVGNSNSIRSSDPGVSVLEKILTHRLKMIDPNNTSECPFSSSDAPSEKNISGAISDPATDIKKIEKWIQT
ncbi:MAG: siderophore biosynthesis protein [Pseudomonadota bacterium]